MELDAQVVSIEGQWEGQKTRELFLKLVSSHGNPEESSENALALLRRVCFIQEWSSFEIYLRDIVAFLLRKHPAKLAASTRGKKIAAEQIIEMSDGLTSIEELRERLVRSEIEARQTDGRSVHGLIRLLKDEFQFKRDPYCEPYIFQGKRGMTHHNDLNEIREVRNSLIHDGGNASPSLLKEYPRIAHNSGAIVITSEYYLTSVLILRAVGLGIADSIATEEYSPN